jgi:S-adenosylmethionine hydrolase
MHIAGRAVRGTLRTYAAAADGELLALVGSHGYLEVAVRNGSAAQLLGVGRGTAVQVLLAADPV